MKPKPSKPAERAYRSSSIAACWSGRSFALHRGGSVFGREPRPFWSWGLLTYVRVLKVSNLAEGSDLIHFHFLFPFLFLSPQAYLGMPGHARALQGYETEIPGD